MASRKVPLLLVSILTTPCIANQDIWLTAIQPFTGDDWDAGISMAIGGQMMVEEINANPDLLPGYTLKIAWQDGKCSKGVGTNLFLTNLFDKKYKIFPAYLDSPTPYADMVHPDPDKVKIYSENSDPFSETWDSSRVTPNPIGLLGSGCAGTAINIANIAYKARMPIVSNSATRPGLSDRSTFPNFFRTIMPDTFFNAAWIATAKSIGQNSVGVVIGETSNWATMGQTIAAEAARIGVELKGLPYPDISDTFKGYQISLDSNSAAKDIARELVRGKNRVVVLLMFAGRNRMVLCASYKAGLRNVVWMPFGWLAFGWWAGGLDKHDCTEDQMNQMALGYISANVVLWRPDKDAKLACATDMTVREFEAEWFRRQGNKPVGDLSMRADGYAPAKEAATTADAACMYARMLHQLLVIDKVELQSMVDRTQEAYDKIIDYFGTTEFSGVQGTVLFQPGRADPFGSVIMEQLQKDDNGAFKVVGLGTYTNPVFSWFENVPIVFQYPGEVFSTGTAVTELTGVKLGNFSGCPTETILNFEDNQCYPCGANKEYQQLSDACLCVAGMYADDSDPTGCSACPAGKFAKSAGTLTCSDCDVGKFAKAAAATCTFCPQGTYNGLEGQHTCSNCSKGSTTAAIASTEPSQCICQEGFYLHESSEGASCKHCPANGFTLGPGKTNVQQCMCPRKHLKKVSDPYTCVACPAGLKCETQVGQMLVGSLEKGGPVPDGVNAEGADLQPVLQEFFWSSSDDTLNIFRCSMKERCPGGIPGVSCADNVKQDRACADCVDGWIWSGKKCVECMDVEKTAFLWPIIPIILMPIIIVVLYKIFGDTYERWGTWRNGMASIGFIMLNHYQILTVIRSANIVFPVNVAGVYAGFSFSSDVSTLFKPECAGTSSFKDKITVKTIGPILVAAFYVLTWGISQVVGKVSRKPDLAMEPNRTLNGFFSLIFTFFAGICEMALTLFKCGPNPNGKSTLLADRSVICTEDEWNEMLAAGIFAVVAWCIGFGGFFARTVFVAPKWFHDKGAQMRYKFLFIKFRADVHWWALVLLLKGFMINFGFLFLETGVAQIYWVMAIVIAYLAGTTCFRPWRHRFVNAVDTWTHLCIILIASCMTWFARDDFEDLAVLDQDMSNIVIVAAFFCLPLCPIVVGQMYYDQNSPNAAAAKLKDTNQLRLAVQKLADAPESEYADHVKSLSEWDYWFLMQAKGVIMTEFLGCRSRSGLSSKQLSNEKELQAGAKAGAAAADGSVTMKAVSV